MMILRKVSVGTPSVPETRDMKRNLTLQGREESN